MVIDICAGWLPTTDKIGELKIARSHGKEVLSVEYDNNWLMRHNIMLDPDLALYSGVQYPYGKDTFGFLSRTLLGFFLMQCQTDGDENSSKKRSDCCGDENSSKKRSDCWQIVKNGPCER